MTLVDRVARRLRAAGRACRTVVLRLRFDDYSKATRSHTVPEATARTATLLKVARALLAASNAVISRRGLTLLGIALTNLCDARAVQLALPFDRAAGLDRTLDELRERFGSGAISRGTLLGSDSEPWVPLLPDLGPTTL
jgi:DNA polymerase-4